LGAIFWRGRWICCGWYFLRFGASLRVLREFAKVVAWSGAPKRLRKDSGTELASRRYLAWCVEHKIETVSIQPWTPVQNAYSESFNGNMRDEFLNLSWSTHRWDARTRAVE